MTNHRTFRDLFSFLLLFLFCLWVMVSSTVAAVRLVGQPFPGFAYFDMGNRYAFVNAMNQTHWTGWQSHLRFQDVIAAVSYREFKNHQDIDDSVKSSPPGSPIPYAVIKWENAEVQKLTIASMIFSWQDFWNVYGFVFLIALLTLSIALIVYILRPMARASWPFVLFSMTLSLFCLANFEASFLHTRSWLYWLVNVMLPVTYLHLTVSFPVEIPAFHHKKWVIPGMYGLALLAVFIPFSPLRMLEPELIRNFLGLTSLMTGIVTVFFFVFMLRLYLDKNINKSYDVTVVKLRVKFLLLGAFFAFVVPGGLAGISIVNDNFYVPFNYLGLFVLAFPVMTGVSIVQFNLFNVDAYVKKSLTWFIYMGIIVAIYFLVTHIARSVGQSNILNHPFFPMAFALFVFVLFTPFSQTFQTWLSKLLSPNQMSFQQFMEDLSMKLTRVLTVEQVIQLMKAVFIEQLKIRDVSIALNQGGSYQLVALNDNCHLQNWVAVEPILKLIEMKKSPIFIADILENPDYHIDERMRYVEAFNQLEASLIIPLLYGDAITGIIILGNRSNHQPYSANDIQMLKPLANQVAIALENANYYQTIQVMNQELENKVALRTQELEKTIAAKEKAQEQLIQSESLAAIGQLVAGVAHELNNPLGSAHSLVQTTVEILETKKEMSPEEADILDDLKFVLKEQTRAKDIVGSLKDLSRQTHSYEEPIQLNEVINDAIRVLQVKFKYIDIIKNYAQNLPVIKGNFAQMGQVCVNVIQNALQAVPEQGGRISLETLTDGTNVIFRCIDNGNGLSEKDQHDLFKPFYTSKPVGEGTGLGLYISHQIVSRHEGSIRLFNNPSGSGVTAEIIFPIRETGDSGSA